MSFLQQFLANKICNERPDWGWRVFPLAPIVWWTQLGYRLSLSLCWTFKLSAVKQINLFLPAHVFLIFLLTSVFLSSIWPCLCWLSLVLSPPAPLVSTPLPPFIWRAGSGVTNYSERAEKVVWVLPSGLPCWIIIREIAGMRHNNHNLRPSTGRIDSAKFKPCSCLSGWLAPTEPPSLTELLGRTNMDV